MSEYKLLMPKMGESVIEATILAWHKSVGDTVSENEILLEVATDKVDSEVPSPVKGVIKKILHDVNDVVPVGGALAIIETEGGEVKQAPEKKKEEPVEETETQQEKKKVVEDKEEKKEEPTKKTEDAPAQKEETKETVKEEPESVAKVQQTVDTAKQTVSPAPQKAAQTSKYYSPLVLNIAQVENVSMQELETIEGSGADNRVTKEDILQYVEQKKKAPAKQPVTAQDAEKKGSGEQKQQPAERKAEEKIQSSAPAGDDNVEIIEMDRMRKLIAQHMINSKKTSAHVSSIVECDVTNIVRWRDKHKEAFQKREGFSLSFMAFFVDAITRAIKEFPMINVSVDGDKILRKKDINMGIATALPSGNLIVPVIKNTDQKSLLGIAKAMNVIVQKARTNTLQPDDIAGGTYTISNIGTFGNIIGTPIINQPQVAIMAVGSITKKPVVMNMDGQDVIAIRHMMYLSHTYDHRVVDGMLGGMFVKKVAELLEKFDLNQEI
jgi:2-oxoglutarate dehydrogenase E2 component (dihydrolipoamide succinyltransferase)